MPAFHVYVLHSPGTGIFYTGHTGNLKARLAAHNDPERPRTKFTAKHLPWILVHSEEFATRSAAMAREKFLKSGQGRAWLKMHLQR